MSETSDGNVEGVGGPKRMTGKPALPVGVPLVLAGGAFALLVGSQTTSTRGSTRSCELKWEQRQAEIDAAVAEASAAPVVEKDGSAGG
jgi:hypothetical protein